MQDLNIAFIQANLVWENPEANLAMFDALIAGLVQKPDLIVLPETFTTGFPVDPHMFAAKPNGREIEWMREKARVCNAVVCGSILLELEGVFHNSLIWMTPKGDYQMYHKRHVFRMGGEHKLIQAGTALQDMSLNGWNIRPLICYDLRFPVWCRNTIRTGQFDYDLLIFVANWPAVRSYPWIQLLIARAMENQAFVLGVNRVGVDGLGNRYSGDSMLIDPKGNIVVRANPNQEQVIETSIQLGELLNFRKKFNVALDWDDFKMIILPPD